MWRTRGSVTSDLSNWDAFDRVLLWRLKISGPYKYMPDIAPIITSVTLCHIVMWQPKKLLYTVCLSIKCNNRICRRPHYDMINIEAELKKYDRSCRSLILQHRRIRTCLWEQSEFQIRSAASADQGVPVGPEIFKRSLNPSYAYKRHRVLTTQ